MQLGSWHVSNQKHVIAVLMAIEISAASNEDIQSHVNTVCFATCGYRYIDVKNLWLVQMNPSHTHLTCGQSLVLYKC